MNIVLTSVSELPSRAAAYKEQGFRLVQICCTRLASGMQLSYTFEKNHDVVHLRLDLAVPTPPVPSISGAYWGAFAYENEMHDLFGLDITGMNVNYNGAFYKTSIPKPFAEPACLPTAGKPPAPKPQPSTPPASHG